MIKKTPFPVYIVVCLIASLIYQCALSKSTAGRELNSDIKITEFINNDGRFDLGAVRQSGYQGPLDISGFSFSTNPATGQPVFMPSTNSKTIHPDDIYWDNGISPCMRGVNGSVKAAVVFNDLLIIGGTFTVAGCVKANRIAAWNGSEWMSLCSGMNNYINALAVYDNKLIAAGFFTEAGGIGANYIAAWDGISWSALGSGMDTEIWTLTVYDDKLIAGGYFIGAGGVSCVGIAAWNGSTWSKLGTGINGEVSSLTIFDNKLVAGGLISMAGGISVNNVASWDGSSWSAMGSGINGPVCALTVYDNQVIAGGSFSMAGGINTNNISAWDGFFWAALGSGVTYGKINALSIYNGLLIAGGDFTYAGDMPSYRIAAWDGNSWLTLDQGVSGIVEAMTIHDNKLIVGGEFWQAGGANANNIAIWDNDSWSSLGSGTDERIFAMSIFNEHLIVGGRFTSINGVAANHVAAWDGSIWSTLGSGITGTDAYGDNSYICDLTVYDDQLIAGGAFTTAGGISANCIAAWDGSTWSALGLGISGDIPTYPGLILTLAVFNGQLIAGGSFNKAGGSDALNIAAWDGSTWSALGSGVTGWIGGDHLYVSDIADYNNQLIVGGAFTTAGGISANCIAAWDGSSWWPLGAGISGTLEGVRALTIYNNKLIAGGNFWKAGDIIANGISAWDGTDWLPLGSGMGGGSHGVFCLTEYDNRLVAGGYFTSAGGVSTNHIAVWDGSTWSPLGSGMNSFVRELVVYENNLLVGGSFTIAGDQVAAYMAQWEKKVPDYFCQNFSGLFCDDFNSGASQEWTTTEGDCTWETSAGHYGTTLTGSQLSCVKSVGNPAWENYVCEVMVRGNAGVDKIVRFRETDAEIRYFVNLRSDWLGQDELILGKQVGGDETILATEFYPSSNGIWYTLKIACVDEHISIFVDDDEVISYDDSESRIYSGGIGLVCFTGSAGECDISFDNVRITDPFPHIIITSVNGQQVGDEVTISGFISDFNGDPLPLSYGCFGVENPMKNMTEIVSVAPDGTFDYVASPVRGAEDPGTYLFDFAACSDYGSVHNKLAIAIHDPSTPVQSIVNTGYTTKTGPLPKPIDDATQFIANKLSAIPPPPWAAFDPVSAAKDLYTTGSSFIKGGWERTAGSTDGKMLIDMFNNGHESCLNDHELSGCAVAMGTSALIGESTIMSSFKEAFHQLVDIGEDENILTTAETETAHFSVDAGFMVLNVLQVYEKPKGWFKSLKYGIKTIRLPVKYIDIVHKYLPDLKSKSADSAHFSMIVEDADGDIIAFGVHPKWQYVFTAYAYSPVNLSATDPMGHIVTSEYSEIPFSSYYRVDADQDGDSITILQFPMTAPGEVSLEVIPTPGSSPTDSFTLIADYSYYEEPLVLLENELIVNAPTGPIPVETFENLPPQSFDLIGPGDTTFQNPPILTFLWHNTVDQNPEHTIRYDLVIRTDSLSGDSLVIYNINDTSYLFSDTLPTDTIDFRYFWRVRAHDLWGLSVYSERTLSFSINPYFCGDANADGNINLLDILYLIDYLYGSPPGPAPDPIEAGDVNDDGAVNLLDILYLIDYLYGSPPGPDPVCP